MLLNKALKRMSPSTCQKDLYLQIPQMPKYPYISKAIYVFFDCIIFKGIEHGGLVGMVKRKDHLKVFKEVIMKWELQCKENSNSSGVTKVMKN